MTGNPVRKALTSCTLSREEARRALGLEPERPLVLVVGGSLGARTINSAIIASMESGKELPYQILWQTGKKTMPNDVVRLSTSTSRPTYAHAHSSTTWPQPTVPPTLWWPAPSRNHKRASASGQSRRARTVVAERGRRPPAQNAEALAVRDAAVMIPDADAAADLMAAVDSSYERREPTPETGAEYRINGHDRQRANA